MTESSRAVFLSYASEDAPAAQRIADALRDAGIEVWFDQSELRGGDAWDQSIRKQIKNCALFIPIVSRHTHDRAEGYFRLEWKLAVDRSHLIMANKAFLLPVVIDDSRDDDENVPDKFRDVQWTRLPAGQPSPVFIEWVRKLLSADSSPAGVVQTSASLGSPTVLSSKTSDPPPPWRSKPALWAIGAALAVALSYFVVDKFWVSRRAAFSAASTTVAGGSTSSALSEKSIAVLAFSDMSEKKDQEYFADGMAEEILDQLVKVPQLKVISRTSSFQYKGRNTDARTIGRALGARYLVEGSVRRAGNQLRITAELIDSSDGSQRWSDRYDRDIGDVLKVQDEIATELVRALQVSVGAFEVSARTVLRVPAAYDAYLRGRRAADRYDQKGLEEAADDYREALRLDPQFARAAAALAVLQAQLAIWGYSPADTAFTEARASAELAIRLDDSLAMPHAALALVSVMHNWDWPSAQRELERASALEPRDWYAEMVAAQLAAALGDWDKAQRHINASLALDPLNAVSHWIRSDIQLRTGHAHEAEAAIRRCIQISPSYVWAHQQLGKVLVALGKFQEALAVFQEEPDDEARRYGLATVNFALGRKQPSDEALEQLTKIASGDWAYGIAAVHAFRGEVDEAFKWLDRAYVQKDVDLILFKGDPDFARMVGDPRYKAFLRKMDLPE